MLENYKVQKILGQGRYGHVLKCLNCDTEETVAVKLLKDKRKELSKIREIFILEKLRCLDPDKTCIVRCHEWFHRMDHTFIVFEMLDMSLHDYMSQREWAPMPLDGIRTVIKDVAKALKALKGFSLIHADLKLDNIMLVDHNRQPFRVKLIDFGLTLKRSEAKPGLHVQALWYRSPEVILGSPFTEAIDIWSLGLLMAYMLLGYFLFPGKQEYHMLRFMTDLLGEPPKRLLDKGIYTELFYYGSCMYVRFIHWTLKTPVEFFTDTGITLLETRRHRFTTLDELKTLTLHKENSAEAVDRSACVELLKVMLQMDPRKRTTPRKILAHPFITRSYLSPSNSPHNETAAAENNRSQGETNTKGTAETEVDDMYSRTSPLCEPSHGCPTKLPPSVTMGLQVKKTTQRDGGTKQNEAICFQTLQDKLANCQKAKDDSDLILESVSDDDLNYHTGLKSITDNAKTIPSVDHDNITIPVVSTNSCVQTSASVLNQASSINSLYSSDVHDPKNKKQKGIRRFFSCFCVPEEDDEE
ncbi:homeodomain-interacting protein kinase 1-like isoform X2 [Thunnus thynnus]